MCRRLSEQGLACSGVRVTSSCTCTVRRTAPENSRAKSSSSRDTACSGSPHQVSAQLLPPSGDRFEAYCVFCCKAEQSKLRQGQRRYLRWAPLPDAESLYDWGGGRAERCIGGASEGSPAPGARAACAAPPCAAAARTPACARGCAAACAAPARPPAWPAGRRSCPAQGPHRASDSTRACLIMLLCSATLLLHACLKWQHMSLPYALRVPTPLPALHMAQVRRLAKGLETPYLACPSAGALQAVGKS